MKDQATQVQQQYYARTAAEYDRMHVVEDDEHFAALRHVLSMAGGLGIKSVLDVGSGTGRAVKFLLDGGLDVKGIEPVSALIDQAVQNNGVPAGVIQGGSGEKLPFDDASFDAVIECGVLHHVPKPPVVVAEMMRVARKAVFISDSNRFGQGGMAGRWVKLMIFKAGLWPAFNYAKTRGKGYTISEGDGLAYSYSVYDSYDQIAKWADRMVLIPTAGDSRPRSWLNPLLTASHVLMCGFRAAK